MQSLGVEELSRVLIEAVFDGEALSDGAMEVSDFAPAMLGIAEVCQRANRILNGDKAHLSVQIRSDLRRGSIHADLNLVLQNAGAWVPLIPATIQSASDIANVLFGNGSVFDLFRIFGDNAPKTDAISNTADGDIALNVPGDGNSITINQNVYNVFIDPQVRKSAAKTINVVGQQGVDALEIGTKERKSRVTKKDIKIESLPPSEPPKEQTLESQRNVILDVIAFVTRADQKSHFWDGESHLWALIEDDEFWDDYHSRRYGVRDRDRFQAVLISRQVVGKELKAENILRSVKIIEPQ